MKTSFPFDIVIECAMYNNQYEGQDIQYIHNYADSLYWYIAGANRGIFMDNKAIKIPANPTNIKR